MHRIQRQTGPLSVNDLNRLAGLETSVSEFAVPLASIIAAAAQQFSTRLTAVERNMVAVGIYYSRLLSDDYTTSQLASGLMAQVGFNARPIVEAERLLSSVRNDARAIYSLVSRMNPETRRLFLLNEVSYTFSALRDARYGMPFFLMAVETLSAPDDLLLFLSKNMEAIKVSPPILLDFMLTSIRKAGPAPSMKTDSLCALTSLLDRQMRSDMLPVFARHREILSSLTSAAQRESGAMCFPQNGNSEKLPAFNLRIMKKFSAWATSPRMRGRVSPKLSMVVRTLISRINFRRELSRRIRR